VSSRIRASKLHVLSWNSNNVTVDKEIIVKLRHLIFFNLGENTPTDVRAVVLAQYDPKIAPPTINDGPVNVTMGLIINHFSLVFFV
jgi:hypothetical protein